MAPIVVGKKQQTGTQRVNLRPLLDSQHLAIQAADLNLKLMKWRMIPDLNIDMSQSTKVLIIGAGTLGCSVARTLLGWAICQFSFVDNGNVSSKPHETEFVHFGRLSLQQRFWKTMSGEFMTDLTKQVIGEMFGADNGSVTPGVLTALVLDMQAAYTDTAARGSTNPTRTSIGGSYLGGMIGGMIGDMIGGVNAKLTPGVYTFNTVVSIIGDIYFEDTCFEEGQGDTDVFVIQILGDLTQVANSKVILLNGTLAENVIRQAVGYSRWV
jgi:hypothetical protein